MEYTILILILPFLSFLILGLAGMRMKNSVAGAIGTASLTGVALLSYLTAFHYFTGGRTAAGTFPTLMPYNFECCRSQPTFISIWAFCSILFPS
jgi:NADH-quinone oxidoreductase subunit L